MKKVLCLLLCLGLVLGVAGCEKEDRYTNRDVGNILNDNGWVEEVEESVADDTSYDIYLRNEERDTNILFYVPLSKKNDKFSVWAIYAYDYKANEYSLFTSDKKEHKKTKYEKELSNKIKKDLDKELKKLNLDEEYIVSYIKYYVKNFINK